MDATNWTNCVGSVVVDFASELESVFNIGTADDKNNVHPVNFYTKCYCKLDNFKRQQVKSLFQPLVWLPRDMKRCGTCKLASTRLRGGRPKKGMSHACGPKTVKTFEDAMELDPSKPICHVISIKMKQST